MHRLNRTAYRAAWARYRLHDAYYPLIAAVLLGDQNGTVYGDDAADPSRFYVEHRFGFAQLFGCDNPAFDDALIRYLTVDRSFESPRVRLYTPCEPEALRALEFEGIRSERQRFELDEESHEFTRTAHLLSTRSVDLGRITLDDLDRIESRFGVVNRFWRNRDDFVDHARAHVARKNGEPVAICYAAAVAAGVAEIDVATAPEHRRTGLGGLVVQMFNEDCLQHGLRPVWDCFTNNAGSMALCRATGFRPSRPPYPFYTFQK